MILNLTKEVQLKTAELTKLKSNLSDKESELEKLQEELQVKEQEFKTLQSKLLDKEVKYDQKVKKLQDANAELKNTIEDQKVDIENLKNQINNETPIAQASSATERTVLFSLVTVLAVIALVFIVLYCRLLNDGACYEVHSPDSPKITNFERGPVEMVKYDVLEYENGTKKKNVNKFIFSS